MFDLEYNHFGLPRADVFVFYDVEPAQAGENVLKKGHRDYLGNECRDVYEASGGIQRRAREKYLEAAAQRSDILVIQCMQGGCFRTPADISRETLEALRSRGIL